MTSATHSEEWKIRLAASRSPRARSIVISLAAAVKTPRSLIETYTGMAEMITHWPYCCKLS